jgi:uncharacterized oxidoreductase
MQETGHKVLITGGGRGIGRALADRFAAAGNQLLIVGRSQPDNLPDQAIFIACDLADQKARQDLIAHITKDHADLSVLINNAGLQHEGVFATDWHYDDYAPELATNINAVVALTDGLLPLLKARKEAAIVNISSALAIQPKQDAPIYCASKAFIRSFTKSLRYQLAGSPIRVIDVVPPLVDTDMTRGRGTGKITTDKLADIFWRSWRANKENIYVGKAGLLQLINRLSPALASRIVRHG